MRRIVFAAAIAALFAISLTAFADQRSKSRVRATGPVRVAKASPADAGMIVLREVADQADRSRFRGLTVIANPEATGEILDTQRRIAALMTRLDYLPAHRVQAFRYIPDQIGLPITGWRGQIVETVPTRGGLRVTVHVAPIVGGLGTSDHAIESYFLREGRLAYIGSVDGGVRGVSTFN